MIAETAVASRSVVAPTAKRLSFANKVIMAPMVRVGLLPFRLLALEYGADIVYSEEIIDKKLLRSRRVFNEDRNVTEFRSTVPSAQETLVYETCPADRPSVVQLGTASPELALEASKMVIDLVDGIDINMCCPKHFSLHAGMGAGLLKTQDLACDIVRALRKALPADKTVTCKILLCETVDETVRFIRRLEEAGIDAVAIQSKFPSQSGKERHNWQFLAEIVPNVTVPVIGSGDLFNWDAVERFRALSKVSSVMLARGALRNFSIFRKGHDAAAALDSIDAVLHKLVGYAQLYKAPFGYVKYIIGRAFESQSHGAWVRSMMSAKSYPEMLVAVASAAAPLTVAPRARDQNQEQQRLPLQLQQLDNDNDKTNEKESGDDVCEPELKKPKLDVASESNASR